MLGIFDCDEARQGALRQRLHARFGHSWVTRPMPIFLTGLALRHAGGETLAVMFANLETMPKLMTEMVEARGMHQRGIDRARLPIHISGTCSGPGLNRAPSADRAMMHRIEGHRRQIMDAAAEAAVVVLDLSPKQRACRACKVGFVHNWRDRVRGGCIRFGMDPDGLLGRIRWRWRENGST